MQRIIKTSRPGVITSTIELLAALPRRLTLWLSAPPARGKTVQALPEASTAVRSERPRRRAGDPIGSVRFDGERLGGWPGEGKIR